MGTPGDDVVAVTSCSTYSVRIAETTNSLLLLPEPDSPLLPADEHESEVRHITNTQFYHLELLPIHPVLPRLHTLLAPATYAGPELEDADTPGGLGHPDSLHTTDQLLDLVQASPDQLMSGLAALHAVSIGGFWRLLDPAYAALLLDVVLTYMAIEDIPLTGGRIELDGLLASATEYNPDALGAVLARFAVRDPNVSGWVLNPEAVALFKGIEVLGLASDEWVLSEFVAAWRDALPEEFHACVNVELLHGHMAIAPPIDVSPAINALSPAGHSRISLLRERDLPRDHIPRFDALFAAQSHWSRPALQPYLTPLVPPNAPVDPLLLKHTRSTVPPDHTARVYSSRY